MKVPRLVVDWPAGEQVPSSSHEAWGRWSAPLLVELRTGPKTWSDLRAWAKAVGCTNGLLQNLLAWLSLDGWSSWDVDARLWMTRTPQERAWHLRERARLELSGCMARGGRGSDDDT